MLKILSGLIIFFSAAFGARVFADTPGDPYTVDLGPGNEDLEKQINAVPWTQVSFYPGIRVKNVSEIDFKGRDLSASRVRLLGDGLMNANFEGCRFDGSSFMEVSFYDCTFQNASIRYCEFRGLAGWHHITNDLSNADITGSWLWDITQDQLMQTKNYQDKRLVGTYLGGRFEGLDLNGFLLDGCKFRNAINGINIVDATFRRMWIPRGVRFSEFQRSATYRNKDLSQIVLGVKQENSDDRWDLSGCILGYFVRCDFSAISLKDAFFPPKVTTQLDYLNMELPNSISRYFTSVGPNALGLDNCEVTEAMLSETKNWRRKDIRSLHLRNMDLNGWDFSGFRMGGADLKGSNVKGAKFTGAMLRDPGWGMSLDLAVFDDCQGLTVAQLMESETFAQKTRQSVLEVYGLRVAFDDLTDEEKRYLDYRRMAAVLTRVKAILRE